MASNNARDYQFIWDVVLLCAIGGGFGALGPITPTNSAPTTCGCLALESGLANEILLESGGTDCILEECAPAPGEDCLLLETGSPNEILLESGGADCLKSEAGVTPPPLAGPIEGEAGGGDDLLDEAGGDIDNEA